MVNVLLASGFNHTLQFHKGAGVVAKAFGWQVLNVAKGAADLMLDGAKVFLGGIIVP